MFAGRIFFKLWSGTYLRQSWHQSATIHLPRIPISQKVGQEWDKPQNKEK